MILTIQFVFRNCIFNEHVISLIIFNKEIYKNWYSSNIDETTVLDLQYDRYGLKFMPQITNWMQGINYIW